MEMGSEVGGRDDATKPTGLLLVHGIGDQKPGDTTAKFVKGLTLAVNGWASAGTTLEVTSRGEHGQPVDIRVGDREMRLYEVWWAPKIQKEASIGSFNVDVVYEWAWFPMLNRSRGAYRAPGYPSWMVWLRTVEAVPVSAAGFWAYWGARFLSTFAVPFSSTARERRKAGEPPGRSLRSISNMRTAAREGREQRTPVDDVLDFVVADVPTYVNTAGQTNPAGELSHAARDILDLFRETLGAATRECGEVQILAHSLGTVIAFHGLTGLLLPVVPESDALPERPLERVTHLYTIGSPLEKFNFMWPKLFAPTVLGRGRESSDAGLVAVEGRACPAIAWDNFYARADLVSGRLRSFDRWRVVNHRMQAAGLLTSHVVYERSEPFLRALGEGLLGPEALPNRDTHLFGWWHRMGHRIRSIAENLIAPMAFVLLVAVGLVFMLGFVWLLTHAIAWPLDAAGADWIAQAIRGPVTLFFWAVLLLVAVIGPIGQAREAHRRDWAPPVETARGAKPVGE